MDMKPSQHLPHELIRKYVRFSADKFHQSGSSFVCRKFVAFVRRPTPKGKLQHRAKASGRIHLLHPF